MRKAVGFSHRWHWAAFFKLRLLFKCGLCATCVRRKCGFYSSAASNQVRLLYTTLRNKNRSMRNVTHSHTQVHQKIHTCCLLSKYTQPSRAVITNFDSSICLQTNWVCGTFSDIADMEAFISAPVLIGDDNELYSLGILDRYFELLDEYFKPRVSTFWLQLLSLEHYSAAENVHWNLVSNKNKMKWRNMLFVQSLIDPALRQSSVKLATIVQQYCWQQSLCLF